MIKGVGGKDCINVKFYKMIFQVSNIIEWSRLSGYEVREDHSLCQNNDHTRVLFENEQVRAVFSIQSSMLPFDNYHLLKEEVVLKQSGNIEISFKKEASLEEFEGVFTKVKRLIELSTLTTIQLKQLTGWSADVYEVFKEKNTIAQLKLLVTILKKGCVITTKRFTHGC